MKFIDFTSKYQTKSRGRSPHNAWINPSIYTTTPEIDSSRKFKFSKKFTRLFSILGLCIIVLWTIFYSPVFAVKNLEINGEITDELRTEINNLKSKNIFLLGGNNTSRKLELAMPSIKRATIIRGIPNTIRVNIVEREPFVVWQVNGENYLVDKDAIAFKKADRDNLPKVTDTSGVAVSIGHQVAGTNFVNTIKSIYSAFNGLVGKDIDHLEIGETTLQVAILVKDGPKLLIDTTRALSPQFLAAKKVFDEHGGDIKEYLDLRVTGFAYYK